ncbi:MATE family efflux transporter [Pararhizobium sp. DWP1-1-3]|uniref:MATE family efflux transporter n=1 Tax=Pararhizobium sp. DWP1-1-3 TaxID=2804652 RepID=UPI003CFADCE0
MATFMLGWFGAGALAANQIVNSIGATLYMLPLGMATAVAIRIAQADGSGHRNGSGLSAWQLSASWRCGCWRRWLH